MGEKVALVTGGNRGIGLETVRLLAQEGIKTILGSRNPKLGEEAVHQLKKKGLSATPLELDVTSLESIRKARGVVEKKFGRLDILINNAAVYLDENKKLHELEDGIFVETLHSNLVGPLNLCREFIPLMKRHRYGQIVNLSSGMGESRSLTAGSGAYKISKYALNALTRVLADEVDARHIKINSVCPGWVRTRMGGPNAVLSPKESAEGVVWAALLPETGPSGKFFRYKKIIDW